MPCRRYPQVRSVVVALVVVQCDTAYRVPHTHKNMVSGLYRMAMIQFITVTK